MKLWKKHRSNPEARLRECFIEAKKKHELLDSFDMPTAKTYDIIKSADSYLSRERIREILLEVISTD